MCVCKFKLYPKHVKNIFDLLIILKIVKFFSKIKWNNDRANFVETPTRFSKHPVLRQSRERIRKSRLTRQLLSGPS